MTITINKTALSLVVIIALLGIVGFLAYQLYFPKTGYTVVQDSYQGFSSYEEMMQAHHGNSQSSNQGVGDCGPGTVRQTNITQGEVSEYGISYDQNGYQQLLNYDRSIKLDSEQMKNYVGLNVHLPQCCDFKFLQANGNCECGHHIALSGLAKFLITKDYDKQKIQQELDKWKLIFYPEGSAGTGEC